MNVNHPKYDARNWPPKAHKLQAAMSYMLDTHEPLLYWGECSPEDDCLNDLVDIFHETLDEHFKSGKMPPT